MKPLASLSYFRFRIQLEIKELLPRKYFFLSDVGLIKLIKVYFGSQRLYWLFASEGDLWSFYASTDVDSLIHVSSYM